MNAISSYFDLVKNAIVRAVPVGIDPPELNPAMFPHQRHATEFALRQGRAALFLDTGLGKSLCALDWGRVVATHTGKPVLMLAPLGVVGQHVREAEKFGIQARACKDQLDVGEGVNVTNYDRLHHFKAEKFGGLILDESSVIKSFGGKVPTQIMAFGNQIEYRLACTATPAPNDHMELGQHCQFLSVMNSNEMLARWFFADQSNMGKYRIKRGGVTSFWNWVASWARCIAKPSDLGFSDEGFSLPELIQHKHLIRADWGQDAGESGDGQFRLLRLPDNSATAIHNEKRRTVKDRAKVIADLVAAEPSEPWIIWCDTDYEADELTALIPDAVEVRGSHSVDLKEQRLSDFASGRIRVLISKPSICGYGCNWQHCARMAFVGLSFSYENYYQAVRRCWRFGQKREVHVHIACADTEESIWQVVNRKSGDHEGMKSAMRAAMARASEKRTVKIDYEPTHEARLPSFLNLEKAA